MTRKPCLLILNCDSRSHPLRAMVEPHELLADSDVFEYVLRNKKDSVHLPKQ